MSALKVQERCVQLVLYTDCNLIIKSCQTLTSTKLPIQQFHAGNMQIIVDWFFRGGSWSNSRWGVAGTLIAPIQSCFPIPNNANREQARDANLTLSIAVHHWAMSWLPGQ